MPTAGEKRGLDILERVRQKDPLLWHALQAGLWYFTPRPDRPELFDQQTAFFRSQDRVAFLLGGNGSGKTEVAAAKVAHFLLSKQPPPRPDTPFWIVSNTYQQVCGVCWAEKLWGKQYIPDCEVDWPRVRWLSQGERWPRSVPLLPWPGNSRNNWVLEFRSYEQGRAHLQARSIGGFWLSEQFTLDVLNEVLRGCRDYFFAGGQIAEFTPVDPELCAWLEDLLDDWPRDWGLYRLNTEANRPHLAPGWYEAFVASVPDEMRATRLTGALAQYVGAIFPSFEHRHHVIEGPAHRPDGRIICGIDWGASEDHPFASVWCARMADGTWYVFDEYWNNNPRLTLDDHLAAIVEKNQRWNCRPEFFADTENRLALMHFAQHGLTISAARKDVLDSIETIRMLLKRNPVTGLPKLFVAKRCEHVIDELVKYRWDRPSKRNGALGPPKPLKRDDDTVDALRYAIYSAEKQTGYPPTQIYLEHTPRRHGVLVEGRGPRWG